MFGRRIYIYERPSLGEGFASFFTMLIFVSIFVFLALYVSYIILIVFLSIGAAIGLVYALFISLRALIRASKALLQYTPKRDGSLSRFFEKIIFLATNTARLAFSDNLRIAGNAFVKSRAYKIISFRKWMWLTTAFSIFVFGLCLIATVLLSLFAFLLAIVIAISSFIVFICVIGIAVSILYALIFASIIGLTAVKNNFDISGFTFKPNATFGIICQSFVKYFLSFGSAITELWQEFISLSRMNISSAAGRPIYSLIKWVFFASPAPLFIWTVTYTVLLVIIFVVFYVLIFIPLFLWTCLASIISIFHK